jgi:Rne/Rng family ribonuclease
MSKELVIAANRHEIKVAILEDDQLVEVFFQRANEYSLAGSIHKGRVTRVLPGMQSAFVDLGLERDTFLYVSDFSDETEEDFDRVSVNREAGRGESSRGERSGRPPVERPPIQESAPESAEAAETELPVGQGSTETEPAAPPQTERTDRGERPDRGSDRGRRSRRRRGRGRGFPDSKYASSDVSRPPRFGEAAPAPQPASVSTTAVPSVEAGPSVASVPATAFSVLPGESLAKYTRSNIQPLDEAEEDEIRDLQETSIAPQSETLAEIAQEAVEEPDDAPVAIDSIEESEIVAAPKASEPEPEVEVAVMAESIVEESIGEIDAEIDADIDGDIDGGVDGPLAESTLAEEESESPAESEAEPVDAQTRAAAHEPSLPGSTPPLSAQVREQGGRFPHRMPRRMRRKMRSGGQGEPRQNESRQNDSRFDDRTETAPAPASTETSSPRIDQPRSDQRTFSRPERAPLPSITELLKEGQEIIVQIAKEPLGQKGARITSHIALPGRYVVYMPTLEHTGVSRKIASDEERLRLKRILQIHHAGIPGGFIVRTAGEGKSEEDLAADMNFLFNLWLDIRQKAEKKPAPLLLHHDLDIVQRTLRDQFTEDFKAIWVDNEELYESVLRFVQRFHPSLVTRVKLYTRPEPIFDAFNITAELEKALRPKVWLKSGGHIVINQTEALVAVDVNTGKYVGRSNRLEDTIVKTNTEAVKEIVRQIRLRDLGGIIVVDFIDMDERKNRQKVMQALEDAMLSDRAPYKILQFNDFGLVAITRKRVKQSLERALCMPCPHCEGAGYVKSVQTVVNEILQEAGKIAGAIESKDVLLRVHPDVAKFLKSNQNKHLEELEEILRRPVLVKADPLLHHEKFDLG